MGPIQLPTKVYLNILLFDFFINSQIFISQSFHPILVVGQDAMSCELCTFTCSNRSDWNAHILQHFAREFCENCNETLIRIGDQLYGLHSTLMCSTRTRVGPGDTITIKSPLRIEVDVDQSEQFLFKEEDSTDCLLPEDSNAFHTDDENVDILETNVVNCVRSEEEVKRRKQVGTERCDKKKSRLKIPLESDENNKTPVSSSSTKNDVSASKLSWKEKRKLINDKYYGQLIECSVDGCNEQIARKKMQSHLAKVHGVQYECKVAGCPAILTTKESFQAHMQRHDPVRERVKCDTCGNTFANKNSLKNHEKLIHLKTAKSHICFACGLRFKSKCFLKEHIYTHTGEKPFSCSCGKTFRTKRLLSIHERAVHRGIKPFKCNQSDCNKAYAYDVDLKRHLFSAHSIWSTKKHPCLICSRIFPEAKLLRKHMDSHGVQS